MKVAAISLWTVALCVAGLQTSSFVRQARAQTSVKIGMAVPDISNLLLYVAKEKGNFKGEGLDVELVQFSSDAPAAQALTAGAVTVNNASIFPVLDSHVAKRDLAAIWSVSNMPGYVWYGLPKYSSISELKGAGKIGVSGIGSQTYYISSWAMERAGLNPKTDVTFIPLGGPLERVAGLKAGQVDAIPATVPGMFILEHEGFKRLLSLKDLTPQFCYEVLYARRSNLARDEPSLRAVIRATVKAKAWALEHRDEATQILMKSLGAPADQAGVYREAVDFALPYFPVDGQFPDQSIDVFLGFYRDQGRIKEIPDHASFIDYRLIDYFQQHPIQ